MVSLDAGIDVDKARASLTMPPAEAQRLVEDAAIGRLERREMRRQRRGGHTPLRARMAAEPAKGEA